MAADAALDQAPGVLGVSYRVQGAADFPVRVDLPGLFSVSNSLAAIAVCAQMGIPEKAMQEALSAVRVRGRCEAVPVYPEMTLLIDYAHKCDEPRKPVKDTAEIPSEAPDLSLRLRRKPRAEPEIPDGRGVGASGGSDRHHLGQSAG